MKIAGTLLVTLVVCLCINGLFAYPTTSKYTSYPSKYDPSTINYGTNKYFNTKYYGPSTTAQYRPTTKGYAVPSTPRYVKTTARYVKPTKYPSKYDSSTINYGTNKYFNTKYYGPSTTAQYRPTTIGYAVPSTPRYVKTTARYVKPTAKPKKKSWFFKI